jgi:DNA-directed RNA polymerase specialized sigma24 family protein
VPARPRGDIDRLAVPKEEPEAPKRPPESAPRTYAHTLSFRLTLDQYRRLRRYVAAEEDRTGRRTTHQVIIEEALADWLERHGG